MRDAVTTAMEVAGMLLLSLAAGFQTGSAPMGCGLAGVALLVTGVLEGRKP